MAPSNSAVSGIRFCATLAGLGILATSSMSHGADHETPALAPVLPDLEWALSSTLAADVLESVEFAGDSERAELRQARIGGAALWRRTWSVGFGADLARGGSLGQASIAYFGMPVHFELGRFPEPFGLIQQEPSLGQPMMELPACLALSPGYGLGLAASVSAGHSSLSIGVFAPTPVGDRLQRRPPDEALTMRITGLPVVSADALLHLGATLSMRRPRDDVISFSALPETVLLRDFHTSSAPLEVNGYQVGGLELGFLAGPVLVQAETVAARVPIVDGPMTEFRGGYVQVGWTYGAERRGYRTARGVFGPTYSQRPVDSGGIGAFELAVRYSSLNLTSLRLGEVAAAELGPEFLEAYSGERARIVSLGLNWYATDDVKFTVSRLDAHSASLSGSQAAEIVQARLQIQFTTP